VCSRSRSSAWRSSSRAIRPRRQPKREYETFEKAAARLNDQREADGVRAAPGEWRRLKKWAIPAFGDEWIESRQPGSESAARWRS
jgi:hypothetical protein